MYGLAAISLANKQLDWDSDTVKVALMLDTYTPDQDAHQYLSDCIPTANETSGAGYTTGGVALTGLTASYTAAGNIIKLDAVDASWTSASFTARTAVVYTVGTTASDSALWGYFQFSANETVSNGTFTITWNASGIFQFTVA